MRKKIFLPILILAIFSLTTFGVINVFAQSSNSKHSSIVQKLAQRFGLNENDVKKVFDEDRQERQAQMQARFEDKLTQDVKDGKITEAQKQAILEKYKELQSQRFTKPENWQNMTPEQRKEFMQAKQEELKSWAKENGIDLKYLFGRYKMFMGGRKFSWHN